MRTLSIFAFARALIAGGRPTSRGNGPLPPQKPAGPTSLSLTKTVVERGGGEFCITRELPNEGDTAAVYVVTSDVWSGRWR